MSNPQPKPKPKPSPYPSPPDSPQQDDFSDETALSSSPATAKPWTLVAADRATSLTPPWSCSATSLIPSGSRLGQTMTLLSGEIDSSPLSSTSSGWALNGRWSALDHELDDLASVSSEDPDDELVDGSVLSVGGEHGGVLPSQDSP